MIWYDLLEESQCQEQQFDRIKLRSFLVKYNNSGLCPLRYGSAKAQVSQVTTSLEHMISDHFFFVQTICSNHLLKLIRSFKMIQLLPSPSPAHAPARGCGARLKRLSGAVR